MLDQIINKINKQDYENAQKDLKKIITTDSSNSKAFYLLGINCLTFCPAAVGPWSSVCTHLLGLA